MWPLGLLFIFTRASLHTQSTFSVRNIVAYFLNKILRCFSFQGKMNTDQIRPNRAQDLPNVFSYCLENKKFRERWQDVFKSADEHVRDTRLHCKELFESEDW